MRYRLQVSSLIPRSPRILAAAGLDIDKDINKTAASFGDAATLLKDGAIDAAFITAGTPTPAVSDLATSTEIVAAEQSQEKELPIEETESLVTVADVASALEKLIK